MAPVSGENLRLAGELMVRHPIFEGNSIISERAFFVWAKVGNVQENRINLIELVIKHLFSDGDSMCRTGVVLPGF
jgi:hypothetical protein